MTSEEEKILEEKEEEIYRETCKGNEKGYGDERVWSEKECSKEQGGKGRGGDEEKEELLFTLTYEEVERSTKRCEKINTKRIKGYY